MTKLNPTKGALLITMLSSCLTVTALENLDDSSMSDVVGQQGVRLISEFDLDIQEVSLRDTDDRGTVSVSNVHFQTNANRQQDIVFRVGTKADAYNDIHSNTADNTNCNGCADQLGLIFYNRDLPYDLSVGQIKINDSSVGAFGVNNFEINAYSDILTDNTSTQLFKNLTSFSVAAYAGGRTGKGLTFDMRLPVTATYSTYYEEDGVRFSSDVSHVDRARIASGANLSLEELARLAEKGHTDNRAGTADDAANLNFGLVLEGLTIDGHKDGLLIGLPTIKDALIAFTDFKIGNDFVGYDTINDIILKDFNFFSGGYALLKPGVNVGEDEVGIDLAISENSGLTYVYRDADDQMSARIKFVGNGASQTNSPYDNSLTQYGLTVVGASINNGNGSVTRSGVDHSSGEVINGMRINTGEVKGRIVVDEIRISPNSNGSGVYLPDETRNQIAPIGELTLNLNLANTSYVEIRGN